MKNTRIALVVAAAIAFIPTCRAAPAERVVLRNTVVSRRDPAVEIKLPAFVHYVGKDAFCSLTPRSETSTLASFMPSSISDQGRRVRKFYWIQFEGYLPAHPDLHYTYDSPRHATIGGLDFYVDTSLSSPTKPPKPGSDGARFYSLLASNGYRRDDLMAVRLVHLVDTMKRKELMIIMPKVLRLRVTVRRS
jgi:hypothetical protein